MNLFDFAQNLGLAPKKVSTANGGEYASACPGCGDGGKAGRSDRFHIWPLAENKGLCSGRFWCRQCDVSGDTIEFLQKYMSMDFPSACMELGIILPENRNKGPKRHISSPSIPAPVAGWTPRDYGKPTPQWQEKAKNLLADCTDRLAKSPEAMEWLEARGISKEVMGKFGLGYNQSTKDGDRYRPRNAWGLANKTGHNKKIVKSLWLPRGWVIPSFNREGELLQLRVRRLDADIKKFCDNIKYLPIDGSSSATMVLYPEAEVFIPVESGFDAILIAGALHGKVGAVCTWNDSARPDIHAHALLSRSALILNGLDYDQAGENQQGWWAGIYKQNRRLVQPGQGIKDPGVAYAAGVDIKAWIVDALPRGLQIKLGFAGGHKKTPVKVAVPARQTDAVQTDAVQTSAVQTSAVQTDSAAEKANDDVVEITLSNGVVIYLTDNQEKWQELTDQGLPVFSGNEMKRLKAATANMTPEERISAAMQTIEVKTMFGGYVKGGKTIDQKEDLPGDHE